jgi:hypothetical protein
VYARAVIVVFALSLTACESTPQAYAPPVQRIPFEAFRPYRVSRIVNMSDGDADAHIVSDILGLSGNWRWTGQRPAVKVTLRNTEHIRYLIDFSVAEVLFKETGPITISFLVNDHVLDTIRYDQHGNQHYEKAIPSEWLEAGKETLVAASLDKVWTSPTDGARLGIILTRIGLTQ